MLWPFLTRGLLVLVLWLCAGKAFAQTLPFIAPGGLIADGLRYSQVVALLGESPSSREKWMPGDPSLHGGIVFEYPAQGLAFVVPGNERPEPDPRVIYLVVRAPATTRTPEGIAIGMNLATVRSLIPASNVSPQGSTLVWTGSQGAGARRAQLHFGPAQTLEGMVFDTGLPPAGAMAHWWKTARVAFAGALVLAAVLALPWLLQGAVAREREVLRVLAPRHRVIGTGMLVLAPVLAVLGLLVLAVGDGFLRLLGLLMLLGGGGLVLTGLYNRTLAAGFKLRWLGAALLVFSAVLVVLNILIR